MVVQATCSLRAFDLLRAHPANPKRVTVLRPDLFEVFPNPWRHSWICWLRWYYWQTNKLYNHCACWKITNKLHSTIMTESWQNLSHGSLRKIQVRRKEYWIWNMAVEKHTEYVLAEAPSSTKILATTNNGSWVGLNQYYIHLWTTCRAYSDTGTTRRKQGAT